MAGVELVITPIGIVFRAFGKWSEGVRRRHAGEIDIAARQGQKPTSHLQRLLEAPDGLGEPAFRNPFHVSFRCVRWNGIRWYPPAIARLCELLHTLPYHRGAHIHQRLPVRWYKCVE